MSRPAEPADRRQTLEERYGVRSTFSRGLTVAAAIGVAGIALAWLVWAAWSQTDREVGAKPRSFDVVSAHEVAVVVDVHRVEGAGVRCRVSAQAEDHTTVGEDELTVPSGDERDLRLTLTLRTSRRAATVIVDDCRPLT